MKLTAPVGKNCPNHPDDVKKVQKGFNALPYANGGPGILKFQLNGLCDDRLITAILRFKSIYWVIDKDPAFRPNTRSWIRFNEAVLADYLLAPHMLDITAKMKSLVGEALDCVKAAEVNVMSAQTALLRGSSNGPISVFNPEDRLRMLNRHFQIDKAPDKQKSLAFILYTYRRMLQVFERPGNLWGSFILTYQFEDKLDIQPLAYTYAGGFDRGGEKIAGDRADTIYLCEALLLASKEQAVTTIVHELAHFVGPAAGNTITDHAYGLPDSPKMQHLTHDQKIHNAECYCNFAFSAKFGRDGDGMI